MTFLRSAVTAILMTIPLCASAEMLKVSGLRPGDTLNVRTGPGTTYADIGDVNENEILNILGHDASGNWAQIRYRGQSGWVSTAFLVNPMRPDGTSIDIGPHRVSGIAINDPDGGLVVRLAPDTISSKLGVLPEHTVIHVIQQDRSGDWAMLAFGANVGWVSTAFLQTTNTPLTDPQSYLPNLDPSGAPLPGLYRVTGVASNDKLWVRDAPRSGGKSLGGYAPGTEITVTRMVNPGWAVVTLSGQDAFVAMRFLTRNN